MSDHTIVLEHPELGGYHATVEAHYYGPVCGAHRLSVIDDEGDLILDYLNRLDPPEDRIEAIRLLLVKHGYLAADDRLPTALTQGSR